MTMKKRINTNCLAGMKCPKCASTGPFLMDTKCVLRWNDDGTDDEGTFPQDIDRVPDGRSTCEECGHNAPTVEFDAEQFYVLRGGKHCPYCGAEERSLETDGPLQADGPNAGQDVRCNECGGTWQDLFQLTGLGNFPDRDFVEEHNEESI